MKYEKCLTCEQLGMNCDGPNLLAMETIDLGLWCNELRKDNPGMTYDKIATETELSKSAVRDFLTGKHDDCSMRTARTIARYITKGKWDDNPCGNLTNSERAAYEERIRQLEAGIEWRDDKIKHFTDEAERLREHNKKAEEQYQKSITFLKEQLADNRGTVKTLKKALISVSIALGVALLVIIAALIVDRLNGDIGFFWLDGLLNPHSITNTIQQWRT